MDSFATRHAHRRSPQVEKQARPPDSSDSEEQVPLLHGNRARSFGTLTPTASFISAAHPSAIPHTAQGAVAEQQATDPKLHRRRLNTTQLFDLYRRLDTDSNNELDLAEFLKVANVLHLNEPSLDEDANTDAFAHIFKTADVNNNGFLSSTEFSRAYDMILALKGKPHRQSVLTHVEAIRYGRLADKYFVSIYTGTVDHINTFQSVVPPRSVQDYSGTLNSLIDMIADDTERNASESSRQNVMWWMDIVCSKRGVSLARELCSVFGLSEESEAMFLSSNLGSRDRSRFCTGLGNRDGRAVHSLGIGIESMWLKNRPVVDMYSRQWSGPLRPLHEYLTPRLSLLYSYKNSADHERSNALLAAEGLAREMSPQFYRPLPTGHEGGPLTNKQDFLLCAQDIKARGAPRYENDVVVFKLLRYGDIGRANCILSFRAFDDYGEYFQRHNLRPTEEGRERGRRGILGRLFTGMRAKVVEVMEAGGVSFDGQIADSSAQLLAGLIHSVHDFTVSSSLSPLQSWLSALGGELEFAAMTKHDKHIRDMHQLLDDLTNYVKPFAHILESHLLQPPVIKAKKKHAQKQRTSRTGSLRPRPQPEGVPPEAAAEPREESTEVLASVEGLTSGILGESVGDDAPLSRVSPHRRRAASEMPEYRSIPRLQRFHSHANEAILKAQDAHRHSVTAATHPAPLLSVLTGAHPYSHGHMTIKHTTLMEEVHEIARESFTDLLYGNSILRKKGCADWLKLLLQYEAEIEVLAAMHAKKLEEQRTTYMLMHDSYWQFVLTIFQVMSWPITFMTGYWGMNFDNMPETADGSYPLPRLFPGYKLMWFAAACVYTIVIAFVLHTKVLHGAF